MGLRVLKLEFIMEVFCPTRRKTSREQKLVRQEGKGEGNKNITNKNKEKVDALANKKGHKKGDKRRDKRKRYTR